MLERDIVVGVVAIGVGLVLLVNAWIKRTEPAKLYSMRLIEQTFGPFGARVFLAILGLALTVMGIYLVAKLPSVNQPAPPAESPAGQSTSPT